MNEQTYSNDYPLYKDKTLENFADRIRLDFSFDRRMRKERVKYRYTDDHYYRTSET